jgi:uncharacterized membrane protein YeaQ/YmgE (transglycosylase-associated protein family)
MTVPSLILGLLGALLIGALFHLWADGGAGRLLLYLLLSLLGFGAGHALGTAWNWILLPLGPLDLGMAMLGSVVFLCVGHWLSLVRVGDAGRDEKV